MNNGHSTVMTDGGLIFGYHEVKGMISYLANGHKIEKCIFAFIMELVQTIRQSFFALHDLFFDS